jgi:threonine/homoserine/homoserine lactone efflux protein
MDLELWWHGLIIGFAIAAPVGPIGLLCIRRTISDGRVAGFVAGLGAATADAVYGCIAALGLTVVSDLLLSYNGWLRIVGGLLLCYLGGRTMLAPPATHAIATSPRLSGAYLMTFGLTLTNPATILSFAAIMASVGVATQRDPAGALVLVSGVFGGSALWWLLLSVLAHLLVTRIGVARLRWLNVAGGAILFAFGVAALIRR